MNPLQRLRQLFQYSLDAYFMFRSPLAHSGPDADAACPDGYTIRMLREPGGADGEALCELWQRAYEGDGAGAPERAMRQVRRLFDDGDICIGLFKDGELVGMDWVGFSGAIARMHFTACIRGERDVAVGHHTWIAPAHRGAGLQRHTDQARRAAARDAGCMQVYVFVGVKNFASVRNMFRVHEQYRLIYHLKVDLPLRTLDLFPGRGRETWQDCRDVRPARTT